ncbi:hypothetical protein IP87_16515 [beta proteobacterium AAP121]|nr:hypothetical protein IP80_00235 [beta proteobacterium AAP65]KPF95537.1 hypothetical protein IP87_16515 [beta proteobacterium AAP121]
MKPALAYLRERAVAFSGRAVIVGKGPSSAEFDALTAQRDRWVIGLNEVALQVPCHAAFVIDEDILDQHAAALSACGIQSLLLPRVLHRPRQIGKLTMYGPPERMEGPEPAWQPHMASLPALRFNLFSAEPDASLGDTVPGYSFSAPTLAHLLALAGFRDIQLAGIDGGKRYAARFADLEYKKLKSLQDSFDTQFTDLRQVRDRFGVRFSSVRCSTATVLIGGEPEQCLATELLKWSIQSQTFLSVDFVEPDGVARDLYAGGHTGTPFSFQRLYLPRCAAHRGRGVYFDSDMLVMRDVYELFNWDMGDNVLLGCEPTPGRAPQYSVFLVNNALAGWDPDALVHRYMQNDLSYSELMAEFSFAKPRASLLPRHWNSLEQFERGLTANVHFTDMGIQPWLSICNPLADLWCTALLRGVAERPAIREALQRSLAEGWVRPSLGWQVERQHPDPWTLPVSVKRQDRDWLPPHLLARPAQQPRWLQLWRWRLGAHVRRLMQSRNARRWQLARIALRKLF